MVTEQEITEAEAAVEVAEVKLDQAEQYHAQAGGERAVMELKAARFDAYGARDRVRQLKSRWAAEKAAGRARAQAEAGFPEKDRKALARRLGAERDAAVAAIVAAEKAAVEALEKVAAYSEAVRAAAKELCGRGLDASDGQDFGGTMGGVVHVGGETWAPADAASVLAAVTASVVRARDARHPFAAARWEQLGTMAQKQAQDALLRRAER